MASVSVSHTIIFIASIIVAASVAGVLTTEVDRLNYAVTQSGLDASEKIQTDIQVISDSGSDSCCYNGTVISLYVKNTGSRLLPANGDFIDVLVDGSIETDVSVAVVDDELWAPGGVVRVEITTNLDPGDHRVKLIVDGDDEVFEFRV